MAIENKNNPESIVNTPEFNPPRNWKNWNSVKTYSACAGPVTPVEHWDLPKDTTVKLKMKNLVKSLPSASPLLGHFKMRLSLFYCPYRLYLSNLNNDNINELSDIEQIEFPQLVASNYFTGDEYSPLTIRPGSLLHYLGYAPQFVVNVTPPQGTDYEEMINRFIGDTFQENGEVYYSRSVFMTDAFPDSPFDQWPEIEQTINYRSGSFDEEVTSYMISNNALPLLAYYDIYCNYILNPNEGTVPYLKYTTDDSGNTTKTWTEISVQSLQSVVPYISRRGSGVNINGINYSSDNNPPSISGWFQVDSVPMFEEIFASMTLDYDQNMEVRTNWLNSYGHQGFLYAPYLPDYFTTWLDPDDYHLVNSLFLPNMNIQQIRLAERKWVDYARQLAKHSKRYSDWLEQKYGGPKLKMDTKPIFVGSDTLSIFFEDVTATAETDSSSFSGTLGGQASHVDFIQPDYSKEISFTTQEPGLLMCILQIVPEVSYGQGIDRFLKKRKMADLYTPLYDAVGFQSIYASEVDAFAPNAMDTIGDVPGWYEYMSKFNKHTGLFTLPEFKSWVLERKYFDNANATAITSNPGSVDNSTYIEPAMFNENFVNVGQYEDNFLIQTLFDMSVKMPMSNQIINTRF